MKCLLIFLLILHLAWGKPTEMELVRFLQGATFSNKILNLNAIKIKFKQYLGNKRVKNIGSEFPLHTFGKG